MSAPGTTTGPTPPAKGLLARAIGIIVSPRETFESVVAHPKWLGMLILTTVAVAFFTAAPLTTEAGRQVALDQQVTQMQSFGVTVSDEMYAQMERGAGRMPYTTAIGVIVISPIMAVIFAGILFAVFNAGLGGTASFKQVFTVVTHAGAVSVLSSIFSGCINYVRGGMGSMATLGSLVPMLPEQSFLSHFLGAIDVFLVWWALVLAAGLAVLYRRRTQPIAIALLAVYAVIALVIAVVKSRMGGA